MVKAIEFVYDSSDLRNKMCSHQFNKWMMENYKETLSGEYPEIISTSATAVKTTEGITETLFVIYEDGN